MRPQIRITLPAWVTILCLALIASGNAGNTITPQTNSTGPAASQAESAAPPDNAVRGAFAVVLVKSLDSKKLKDGDQVICETAGTIRFRGGLLIPSGARVTAHVTRATARSKGDADSSLGLTFDKIEVAKGNELLMKGTMQAVAPALRNFAEGPAHSADLDEAPSRSGAPPMQKADLPYNNQRGPKPLLNLESTGVLGFRDLEMDKDSVLTSNGKEVKLDSGTQILVRGGIQVPGQ